jgi:FkbM family methyltransferase
MQFALDRLLRPGGYIQARAAPFDLLFVGPVADVITRHIHRKGAHEPGITRYLLEHVRVGAGEIAVDVGANLGWYSVLLNCLSVQGAQIFAFEPDPESYWLLSKNLRSNDATRVSAHNIALGSTPGFAELRRYKSSNNGRHTLVDGGNPGGGTVRVPVSTLKDFWAANHLDGRPIRFLKVDVEGFEYFVLRGAGELLDRCECVLLEYSPGSQRMLAAKPDALIELLQASRFNVRRFRDGELVPVSWAELAGAQEQYDLLLTRP